MNTEIGRMTAQNSGTKSATWTSNSHSDVWKYMEKVTNDGKTFARCKFCSKLLTNTSSHTTSNLREHLDRVHTDELPSLRKGPSQQRSMMSFLKPMDTASSKPLEASRIHGITKRLVE